MIRLGAAIDGPSVLYRGIWPSYFAAPFGAAAVAARLLKLDEKQAANALSAALIMAAPGTGHHAAPTTVRWLAVGHAAGRGLQAALAAGAGFTSDLKIAEGDFLKNIFGIAPMPRCSAADSPRRRLARPRSSPGARRARPWRRRRR